MATDKNFVIKNGLTVGTTEVIDSSGNLVNSSGSISGTTITGSDRGTFEDLVLTGDADDDLTFTVSAGDWSILNSQQSNGLVIYDATAGVQLIYNNQSKLEVLTGGLNVVNGTLSIAGTEFADASRNVTAGTISSGAITSSGSSQVANLTVTGDLTVQGTTVTLDTATLNVEDKNITLNYSTGDSSGSANGAGITIQDAVNSTTDATITWDATNDEFDFSHGIIVNGDISLPDTASTIEFGGSGEGGPHGLNFTDDDGTTVFRALYRTTPNTFTFENTAESAKHTFELNGNYTNTGEIFVGSLLKMAGGSGNPIAFMGTGSDATYRNFAYEASDHHYVTNRHTSGDLVLMSNNGTGGGETARITLKAGSGTQDIDITNANLDLNSNNINNVGTLIVEGDDSADEAGWGTAPTAIIGGFSSGNHDGSDELSDFRMAVISKDTNGGNTPVMKRNQVWVTGGISGEAYNSAARWDLGRWENNSTDARSRLDLYLADNSQTWDQVMTWRHDGTSLKVGIQTTTPNANLTVNGTSNLDGGVQVGDTVSSNSYGLLQVNQEANNDESGIGILSASASRSMRLWVDETNSYINSGNGGAANLILNEAITVSSAGNLTGVGTINSGTITATLINGTLNSGTSGAEFEVDGWHYSSENQKRFYFENAGRTFYESASGHQFRDSGDTTRFNISNDGGINIQSGGDTQVSSSSVAIAVGGTTVLQSSRNLVNIAGLDATGQLTTDSHVQSGDGSGGVALTINDGYGNANVTWNHLGGTPEQNGNAARIEVNTDSTSGATMDFEVLSNVTSGTAVSLDHIMSINETGLQMISGHVIYSTGSMQINADDSDFIVADTTDTTTNFIWRDWSASKLNLGTSNAVVTLRSAIVMDSNDITGAGNITSAQISPTTTADATPAIIATNTGGVGSTIQRWVGDSDSMEMQCTGTGDYKLRNTQQNNGINFYDGTGGVEIEYSGTMVQEWDSTGGTNLATGSFKVGGTEVISSTRTISSPSITATGAYGGGTGDFTNVTTPQLKIEATGGTYWRIPHLSGSTTISGVYNYESGKDIYWGEPTDTGDYIFRGRKIDAQGGLQVSVSGSDRLSVTGGDVDVVGTTDLRITGASRRLNFTSGTGTIRTSTSNQLILQTNSTTALTLETNQNATFAANVTFSGGKLTNDTGTILDSDGSSNYIKGGSGGSGILYTEASTFYINNKMWLNTGRGVCYFENNSYSNANGAGVTLRTGTNPSTGSIFDVRSSGQACRLFVGQSITSSGTNPFYAGNSSSTSGQETVSNYAIELATNGNITAEGNVTAYGTVSDIRQKENIEQIDQPIERLQKIKGITFNYKKKSEDKRLMGVIAQELLEDDILKLAVYEHEDFKAEEDDPLKHTYGVKYEHLTAILIEAVKEQQKQIEELKEEVSSLRSQN